MAVFSGGAHPQLAASICEHLGLPLAPSTTARFANTCMEVQLQANCREKDVFLIQPLVPPVDEHLMELLLMADAARGASAARITVVMPHYAYARSDKKDSPRISVGGRLVADLLVAAGVDRVLTMTLHSPQVHAFFSVPVDHLDALGELASHFEGVDPENTVVVSPDLGNAKSAAALARRLGLPVAAAVKHRLSDEQVRITAMVGDVQGKDVIVLDDEIARGSTMVELIDVLEQNAARSIRIACTHGLFIGDILERLHLRASVSEIVTTDTVPLPSPGPWPKLSRLSVAPLMAKAMQRIHQGESVSALFGADRPSQQSYEAPRLL